MLVFPIGYSADGLWLIKSGHFFPLPCWCRTCSRTSATKPRTESGTSTGSFALDPDFHPYRILIDTMSRCWPAVPPSKLSGWPGAATTVTASGELKFCAVRLPEGQPPGPHVRVMA